MKPHLAPRERANEHCEVRTGQLEEGARTRGPGRLPKFLPTPLALTLHTALKRHAPQPRAASRRANPSPSFPALSPPAKYDPAAPAPTILASPSPLSPIPVVSHLVVESAAHPGPEVVVFQAPPQELHPLSQSFLARRPSHFVLCSGFSPSASPPLEERTGFRPITFLCKNRTTSFLPTHTPSSRPRSPTHIHTPPLLQPDATARSTPKTTTSTIRRRHTHSPSS
jgi:hypothetical protein